MEQKKELDFCVRIDGEVISEISSIITQEQIVTTVQKMKQQLIEHNLDKEKIFDIYDISIEMLQNILKYSYGTTIDEDNKREADGKFLVVYESATKEFSICSCNLIEQSQKERILQRAKEVEGLTKKELRKLIRSKTKSRKDNHENGAGLGFATIAIKASKPIDIRFQDLSNGTLKYILEIVV